MLLCQPAQAVMVRIKDISHIKGVRDNHLVGYGVVAGLAGTGDKSRSTQTTQRNLLLNFGNVIESANDIKNANSAAVMITATVPPFAKPGDRIDVIVSSMADSKSLEGGVLIQSQLLAPNGEVIALAQGPISTGGTSASAAGSSTRTAIVTSGRIPNGAIIEREIHTEVGDDSGIEVVLNQSDYELASNVAATISNTMAPAYAMDGGTIRVEFPEEYRVNRIPFIAKMNNLEVNRQAHVSKVVINERTGTVVIGNGVKLQPAAVAHGGITVSIKANNQVSQPGDFSSGGNTLGVSNAEIEIDEQPGSLVELNANASLQDLVAALNALGVTPNDLISILQALKQAGSLEATLEII
ncbi:MAG: flagellar basal body P-ring protein FlgI [Cyanobacteria bacterium HKST-UBA04]|nr:flagellar basal body P-ring protein FlgI [Cyanobacteria bacterium HKST-UBA04]